MQHARGLLAFVLAGEECEVVDLFLPIEIPRSGSGTTCRDPDISTYSSQRHPLDQIPFSSLFVGQDRSFFLV